MRAKNLPEDAPAPAPLVKDEPPADAPLAAEEAPAPMPPIAAPPRPKMVVATPAALVDVLIADPEIVVVIDPPGAVEVVTAVSEPFDAPAAPAPPEA